MRGEEKSNVNTTASLLEWCNRSGQTVLKTLHLNNRNNDNNVEIHQLSMKKNPEWWRWAFSPMLYRFFVTWYSRCHGFHLNAWTRHTSNSCFPRRGRRSPRWRSDAIRKVFSRCRKEPTTTVLQLAALAVARGHKACQWRTAVGRPVSFHIRHIFMLSCVCSHLNQRPLAKVRRHL